MITTSSIAAACTMPSSIGFPGLAFLASLHWTREDSSPPPCRTVWPLELGVQFHRTTTYQSPELRPSGMPALWSQIKSPLISGGGVICGALFKQTILIPLFVSPAQLRLWSIKISRFSIMLVLTCPFQSDCYKYPYLSINQCSFATHLL